MKNYYFSAMSKAFHPLKVKDIRRETDDCVSISFEIQPEQKEQFAYQAGQYLTLRTTIDGEEVRRSYSLCSSPLEDEWRVAVKKVYKGKFSSFANDVLQAGDTLESYAPEGNFTLAIEPEKEKEYVAFAAGSGITPVLSHIKTILSQEPKSTFSLFYGNKNVGSIIFKEELEDIKNSYMDRFKLYHILSRQPSEAELFYGRITRDKCAQFFEYFISKDQIDHYLLCGPAEMIFDLKEFLPEMGIPKEKIHFELFSSPDDSKYKGKKQQISEIEGPESEVKLKLDGKIHKFKLHQQGINILDAGIEHGADLPYSCKGGVCSTCKAKLIQGEVDMEVNYALEPDEIEAGYILSCQAHPKSDVVEVDFDV